MTPESSLARANSIKYANYAIEGRFVESDKVRAIISVAQAIVYLADVMYKNGRHQ